MVHASVTMGPENGVATLEHHKSWLGNIYPICFRDSEWCVVGREQAPSSSTLLLELPSHLALAIPCSIAVGMEPFPTSVFKVSLLNTCYYCQDLHQGQLHPASQQGFYATLAPPYYSGTDGMEPEC